MLPCKSRKFYSNVFIVPKENFFCFCCRIKRFSITISYVPN